MKKLFLVVAVIAALLGTNTAFADMPSPYEMEQRRLEATAQKLEKEGISIEDCNVKRIGSNYVLEVDVRSPKDIMLECTVMLKDNNQCLGYEKMQLGWKNEKERGVYIIQVPLDIKALSEGDNITIVQCKTTINYTKVIRLGGGYERFQRRRPTKEIPKSITVSSEKDIILKFIKNRLFIG